MPPALAERGLPGDDLVAVVREEPLDHATAGVGRRDLE
jgi:hypothetical protein